MRSQNAKGKNSRMMEPGIYYDMPEEDYHADLALSSSAIKNILVSPLNYWVNSRHNPNYKEKDSPSMLVGRAYHTRILEGADKFYSLYAAELNEDDYPDAVKSSDDLRTLCGDLELPKSGTIAAMSANIRKAAPSIQLWHFIKEEHAQKTDGKDLLPKETIEQIELAATRISGNEFLNKAIIEGSKEVSLFWTDDKTGVKMKARFDCIYDNIIIDLKTFSNQYNLDPQRKVSRTITEDLYFVQPHCYLEGARKMIGRSHRFIFVFIQKGAVTEVLPREFLDGTDYFYLTHDKYRYGVNLYNNCVGKYGYDKPWFDDTNLREFTDYDFPSLAFGRI